MISVLSIAFNQKNYTEMLLKSLADPGNADCEFELVFIDNGSTDGTRELLRDYPLTSNSFFKQKTYFAFAENKGVAAAINKGFELSASDFVLQADNDVVFGPHSLSIMQQWMHQHPQGMISPNWPWIQKRLGIAYFKNSGEMTPAKMKKLEKTGLKAKQEPFRATGSCWMCSKQLFQSLGGWDCNYLNICASDDFLWKVALSGAERFTVPCPIYHPGKVTRGKMPKSSQQQEKDLQRFHERWGGHPEDKAHLRRLQSKAGLQPDPEVKKTPLWRQWF